MMNENIGKYNSNKELEQFYSVLQIQDAEFIKEKEYELKQSLASFVIKAGEIFYQVQQRLSNYKNGEFGEWIKLLNISKDTVYNHIKVRNYIVENFDNISDAENIPLSLLYEITKSSSPHELQQAVIEGDITTHKEYQQLKMMYEKLSDDTAVTITELKEQLENVAKEAGKAKSKDMTIKELQEKLQEKEQQLSSKNNTIQTLMNKPAKIEYRTSPEILEQLSKKDSDIRAMSVKLSNLEAEIGEARKISAQKNEIRQLAQRIEALKEEKSNAINSMKHMEDVFRFIKRTKEFIKTEMLHVGTLILPPDEDSEVVNVEMTNIIEVLENFTYALKQKFNIQ